MKFFAPLAVDRKLMSQIAMQVEVKSFKKGEFIFEEGEPGHHLFMILDGEISVVKCKKDPIDGEILEMTTLVKMFRGQSFGETALETKGGKRSAGAYASKEVVCLLLESDDYQTIMLQYKTLLKDEVT